MIMHFKVQMDVFEILILISLSLKFFIDSFFILLMVIIRNMLYYIIFII